MKTISSIEMKDKLDEVLWDIQGSKKRYLIKQENEPAAVLVSLLEWEELMDALEIAVEQADEEFQASLREARKDYEVGRVHTLEHLKEIARKTNNGRRNCQPCLNLAIRNQKGMING